jgi:translocation and assembly module TamA
MKKWLKFTILLFIFFTWNAWAVTTLNFVVKGVQDPAKKNVESALKHLQSKLDYPLTPASILNFYHEAPKVIHTALEPYGYFHAGVIPEIAGSNDDTWTTTFTIESGPQVMLTQIRFTLTGQGTNDPAFIKFEKNLPVQGGAPLNIEDYNKTKGGLQSLAIQKGYFKARLIQNNVIVNLNDNQATIIIHFDTGPRFRFGQRFGQTTFSDTTPFALSFLTGFLDYYQGEYYDWDRLQKTQEAFAKSNYFIQAIITPIPDQTSPNLLVPIHIHLIPRKAIQYIYGLGYGTDTGPRGTLGISFRHLNAYGHRLNFLLQAAQINNSLIATYEIPGPRPTKDTFLITGGGGHLSVKTGKSSTAKLAIGYSTMFGDIRQSIFLTYLNEKYSLTNFPIPNLNAQLLYPSIRWQYLKSDIPLEPNYGIHINARISGTSKQFSANGGGFFQAKGYMHALWTLKKTNTRFLVRGEIGHTIINNLTNLPFSLQLLTGGANTIRGFSYFSIGPGRNLYVGSIELQQKIFDRWYLAAFYDAGNVTDASPFTNFNQTFGHVKQGVGPGIVWLTPLGALELDLAWAVSEPNHPWRIQFNMGPVL